MSCRDFSSARRSSVYKSYGYYNNPTYVTDGIALHPIPSRASSSLYIGLSIVTGNSPRGNHSRMTGPNPTQPP